MTHAKLIGLVSAVGLLIGGAVACSDLSTSAMSDSEPRASGGTSSGGNASNDRGGGAEGPSAGALGPTSNGIILVHAALAPSFRLCFKNFIDRIPTPDTELMPESNVVGVEVGSAVRIPPLPGAPGEVYLFSEEIIRQLYPNGRGPTCEALVQSFPYTTIGNITQDLSSGVHLFVVSGCPKNNVLNTYTKEQCGESFNPDAGNLEAKTFTLRATTRKDLNELPAQVIHLSQGVESFRAARSLKVTFGELTSPNHGSVAKDPPLKGAPVDLATPPKFDLQKDETVYNKVGFRVTVDNASSGGVTKLAEQSLANVQLLSAPREVPSTYYAVGSNYVFLLLGETAPKYTDGGVDPNPNRNVHLLAVPIVDPTAPQPDAGSSGGSSGTADGG